MRVETQVSLKGSEGGVTTVWLAGTVFDDTKAALPTTIKQELRDKTGTVLILPELTLQPEPDIGEEITTKPTLIKR